MTPPTATLAFLSFPEPHRPVINLQVNGVDNQVQITLEQLRGIILAGTSAAWLERKGVEA